MPPTHSVTDRTRALTPLLREQRTWSERHFRMSDEVASALGDARIFALTTPEEYGGLEASIPVELEVYEELSFADPSVAWIVMNSNGIGEIGARFEPDAARRIFTDPTSSFGWGLAPVGRAVPVEGGYEVSGRWPVVSGCHNAAWYMMGNLIFDGDGDTPRREDEKPVVRYAAIPADRGEILDTWSDVVAVKGSGSNAVEVPRQFVEEAMTANLADHPRLDRPRYRLKGGVGNLLMAAIGIGIARATVEAAVDQASERTSALSGAPWREWPSVQDSIASVDAEVLSARAGLREVAEAIWEYAERGEPVPPKWTARKHSMADHGIRVGRDAASRLFSIGSVDALHQGHRLEQALRDVHGFSVQWERYRRLHFEAGRVLLGAEPRDPQF